MAEGLDPGRGRRCLYCGGAMLDLKVKGVVYKGLDQDPPGIQREAAASAPGAVILADKSAAHLVCYERAEAERQRGEKESAA